MSEYTDKTTENFVINKMDLSTFQRLESEGKLSDTELYFVDGMVYENVWVGTQAEYDALETKNPNVYYLTTLEQGKDLTVYTKKEIDDKFATKTAIPTKVSQLTNDSGYITRESKATSTEFGTVKLEFDEETNTLNIIN